MWRERSSTSAARHALAGEARAAAARQDRHAELGADRDRRGDVVGVAREADAERLDRVRARVLRVEMARVGVEADLAVERAARARPSCEVGRPSTPSRSPQPPPRPTPAVSREVVERRLHAARAGRHPGADEPHLDAGERSRRARRR